MTWSVTIRNFGETIDVAEDETILEIALEENLAFPHGCRSGNCGACKSRLHGGEVALEGYSSFALSDEERASGLILACRARPLADCDLSFATYEDRPAHRVERRLAKVTAVERLTHDIARLRLTVEGEPMPYDAGQYASVAFEGLPARDYSFAGQPGTPELEFHVRLTPDGKVSRFVLDELQPGETVGVEGPFGTAHLREHHAGPILALAGGSGLAPIGCIVERALAAGLRQPIRLIHGVRDERDVYMEEHFRALATAHDNLAYEVVLSEPSGPTERRTGLLADLLKADAPDLDGHKAYLAGPPVMVESCVAVLKELGLREADVHADAFYTAAEMAARDR